VDVVLGFIGLGAPSLGWSLERFHHLSQRCRDDLERQAFKQAAADAMHKSVRGVFDNNQVR
jgi:hypothetical protein